MPGAAMPILLTSQPILGAELHLTIPPIVPVPTPHVVVWGVGTSAAMGLPLASGSSKATDPDSSDGMKNEDAIQAVYGYACGRGHDAGPHLGHAAVNSLLTIIWLGAASKSEFASGTVKTPTGNMAVNCFGGYNLQLHCHEPAPMPFGMAIAVDHSVRAGFTLADFFNGVAHAAVDSLVDWAIGKVVGKGADAVLGKLYKNAAHVAMRESADLFGDAVKGMNLVQRVAAQRTLLKNIAVHSEVKGMVLREAGEVFVGTLFGLGVGGPTGGDLPGAPYANLIGDDFDNALDALFYDDPPANQP